MAEQDFISEIMGFNPQDLSAFSTSEEKTYDENIYKTNPVKTKVVSEDGHYRSVVKVLYNPFNIKRSIINQCQYVMQDNEGWLFVNSALAEGDRNCPIFKGWKKLWFSGDDTKKEYAKKMFERNESQWVLVQVIEDENRPELVGKLMLMKLPKSVYNKMQAKMNPSADSKKTPVALMDYLIGPALEMDVTPGPDDPTQPSRKMREISYDLCDFATDATPIMKVDGTPLFSDDEMEVIETYADAKANFEKAKTEAKKLSYKAEIDEVLPQIRDLYAKAMAYLKENAPDVSKECGYQPWDEKTTARVTSWLEAVTNMQDPKSGMITETTVADPFVAPATTTPTTDSIEVANPMDELADNDLPF